MLKRKKKSVDREAINKRNEFFFEIWKERPHKSEISGDKIYGVILTIYFHHILPKSKYPQAEFDKENIILITFEEHQKVEQDIYKYEEINKRRIKLLEKYENNND